MKIRTSVKSGGLSSANHNQTRKLKVRAAV